jgi:ribonuclease HII
MLKLRHTPDDVLEAGIDEAGRGSLWGPLVAGAVIWPNEDLAQATQIKDSKLLSPKRRKVLEEFIKGVAIWSIGVVTAAEIDSMGMTEANRLVFRRAIDGLSVRPGRLLIDGIISLPGEVQIVEPKADNIYLAVAAASILAKEGRDRMVTTMCGSDPTLDSRYSLLSSKGYGTAAHRAGIKEHGMHPEHRRLFLRKLLGIEHNTMTIV